MRHSRHSMAVTAYVVVAPHVLHLSLFLVGGRRSLPYWQILAALLGPGKQPGLLQCGAGLRQCARAGCLLPRGGVLHYGRRGRQPKGDVLLPQLDGRRRQWHVWRASQPRWDAGRMACNCKLMQRLLDAAVAQCGGAQTLPRAAAADMKTTCKEGTRGYSGWLCQGYPLEITEDDSLGMCSCARGEYSCSCLVRRAAACAIACVLCSESFKVPGPSGTSEHALH